MQTSAGNTLNSQRCRVRSLANAMIIASANAHAHGGTLRNCVSMAPKPSALMIDGAKYAYPYAGTISPKYMNAPKKIFAVRVSATMPRIMRKTAYGRGRR
jgi:hypothetical protein